LEINFGMGNGCIRDNNVLKGCEIMNDLKEKAAYLRGLVKGIDTLQDEKQKLVWDGLIDFCDQAAEELNELGDSHDEIAEYIEAIDEDLSQLEKYFYAEDEENNDEDVDIVFSKESDKPLMELSCPYCKEEIYFEDEAGEYEVICPECGNVVWNHSLGECSFVNKTDVI
jgi:DNA-directed RNA polymerase subunit delta